MLVSKGTLTSQERCLVHLFCCVSFRQNSKFLLLMLSLEFLMSSCFDFKLLAFDVNQVLNYSPELVFAYEV